MNIKIKIKCNKCCTIFYQRPKDHINNKQGCPICKESKGEKIIRHYLINNNIKYETQKTFNGCIYKKKLKFDFYLPKYNTCIEFDGEQHSKPIKYFGGINQLNIIQKRDKIKTNYCNNNNIQLIRINYNKKVKKILDNFFNNYDTN